MTSKGVLGERGFGRTTRLTPASLLVRARITGVTFFDFLHGQTGWHRTEIELHPILGFVCRRGSELPFEPKPQGDKGTMEGFLLVDDRDGRVLAEIPDPGNAFRVLDELRRDHPELADSLCLVTFGGVQGSLIGTQTSTRVRPLT